MYAWLCYSSEHIKQCNHDFAELSQPALSHPMTVHVMLTTKATSVHDNAYIHMAIGIVFTVQYNVPNRILVTFHN